MAELWVQMGWIGYPLALCCFVIFALTSYSTVQLFRPSAWAELRTKVFIDAILFWGGFTLIVGFLGTMIGLVVSAQSIEAAGTVSTTLVWGGIRVSLLCSVFGILVLAASSLTWFALQLRWRLLGAAADQEELLT